MEFCGESIRFADYTDRIANLFANDQKIELLYAETK